MINGIGNRQDARVREVAYPSQGKDLALACPAGKQIVVHSMAGYNGSAGSANVGVGYQLAAATYNFYQIVAGAVTANSSLKAGTTTNLFSTTANDGFYIQSKSTFNMVYFNLSQAQAGSPVYDYAYWNGTSFVSLALVGTPSYSATGAAYAAWTAPYDWAQGSGGAVPNMSSGLGGYVIRVRSTTAGSQAVIGNAITVNKFFAYREGISSTQHLQVIFDRPKILDSGEGLIVYYSAASPKNAVDISYQLEG